MNRQIKIALVLLIGLLAPLTVTDTAEALPDDQYPTHCQEGLQQWKTAGDVELMVVTAHPDDEGIFFGGVLPYYTQSRNKSTVLVGMTGNTNNHAGYDRREELERAAWAYGVRIQPVNFGYSDTNSNVAQEWDPDRGINGVIDRIATEIRRYKPEVIVSHDLEGEYGHEAHKLTARATDLAIAVAADSRVDLEGLPPHSVDKLYLHMYASPGNGDGPPASQLSSEGYHYHSWEPPQAELGGETPRQVTNRALQCHQDAIAVWPGLEADSRFSNGGPFNVAPGEDWGLKHSLVGPDSVAGDFFQNVNGAPAQPIEPSGNDGATSIDRNISYDFNLANQGVRPATAWYNHDIAVIIEGPSDQYSDETMLEIVEVFTGLKQAFEQVTGIVDLPPGATPYKGRDVIQVPLDNNGSGGLAGHGNFGISVGVGLFKPFHDRVQSGSTSIDQVFIYEMNRNYFKTSWNDHIDWTMDQAPDKWGFWTVGINNASAVWLTERLGIETYYHGRDTAGFRELFDNDYRAYTNGSQYNFDNGWRDDLMPWDPVNSVNDLMTGTLLHWYDNFGGYDFISRMFREIENTPTLGSLTNFQQARDNWFTIVSRASEKNQIRHFEDDLKWIISAAAQSAITAELGAPPEGATTLVSSATGQCLSVLDASNANDAAVAVEDCDGARNQQFTVELVGENFRIRAAHSQKCLHVRFFSSDIGIRIVQDPCSDGTNALWTAPVIDGQRQFAAVHSQLCMTASAANTNVVQTTCSAGDVAQLWGSTPLPPGSRAPGDVNCDGQMTIVDALLIAQFQVDIIPGIEECPSGTLSGMIAIGNGDMNADSVLDIVDALLISRCVVGVAECVLN